MISLHLVSGVKNSIIIEKKKSSRNLDLGNISKWNYCFDTHFPPLYKKEGWMRSPVFQCCVGLIYLPFSSLPPEVPSSTTSWGCTWQTLVFTSLAEATVTYIDILHWDTRRVRMYICRAVCPRMAASQRLVSGCGFQSSSPKDLENKGTCSLHLLSSQGSEQHQITLLLLNLKHYTSKLSLHVSFLKNNVSSEAFKSESNSYICAPYSLRQH